MEMETIKIQEEAMPIVKSGLNLEEKILELGINEYQRELKNFERENRLSTKEFIQKFNSGELGDDEKWFDWLFAYKAYTHLGEKLKTHKTIEI